MSLTRNFVCQGDLKLTSRLRHGGHLHEIEIAGERYGIPDPEFDCKRRSSPVLIPLL